LPEQEEDVTMKKWALLRVKNAMLLANLVSNAIGVCVVVFLSRTISLPTAEVSELALRINQVFLPCSFLLPLVLTVLYEKPIRFYLRNASLQRPVNEKEKRDALRRLLNEPFFLIALDMGIWLAAAVIYSAVFWSYDVGWPVVQTAFLLSSHTGLITTTVAFFVFEFVMQRRVIPHVFPEGGLSMTPGTIRIRIRVRLVAFLFASNLIPFLTFLYVVHGTFQSHRDPVEILGQLQTTIISEALIFMGVGIWLVYLVSSNMTRPLQETVRVLQQVRNGQFENKVRVTSNDEIGYTGDVINEMTEGLKERDFIKEVFGKYVSKEIRDEILSGKVTLDGELRQVTVLFADLRNFTPMVETTPPKEVVKIINSYFREMDEAITHHHGLVIQYIGDEIEAVFGAPIYRNDHPVLAVRAALEMKERLRGVNRELNRRGYPDLFHGIGIHTGEVLAANIGSPERLSYALVGDTVNLASRVQGLNKEFGTEILITAATRAALNGDFSLRVLPATPVKGKSGLVELYAVE
jgi:adenylate cyclase